MGKLYFKVGADYDKVIRLREECKRLEAQLISMNKNLDPKAFREVEKQMQSTKKEYMAIATEAGRAGAEMGEKLKRQIFDSSKAVNTMSEKISDQRVKTRDLSIEVRTLAESYRTMDKSNPQRTALKSQLDAVRASLTKEKDTLFGLQTEQGKNRLSVKKLRDEYALYDDKVRSTVTTNNHLGNSFKSILAGAGIVFSAQQAFQLAKSIVQVRGEFQQLDVAFTTLLQSKEKANILMGQMTELAAKTPFSLMEVATGAKQLTAYGFKAEEITGTLSRLGDIASGLSLPMERLTYLYGTTMTQGRLYARDLMQFTTSGIPMLQGLADMYGVTTEEVNKMVSAGTIGFPEVKKVIENLTNEGGKFFNLMEEQSKTITGKISNLGDAIDIMFNKMGQSQEGVINGAIDSAKYFVENYEKVGRIIVSLVATYGTYRTALIINAALEIGFNKALLTKITSTKLAIIAQKAYNAVLNLNPYVAVTTLIIGLGTAMWALHDSTTAAEKAQKEYNDRWAEFDKQQQDRKEKIDSIIKIIQDETETVLAKNRAYEELIKLSPAITKAYSMEQLSVSNLTDVQKEANKERDENIKLEHLNAKKYAEKKYDEAKLAYDFIDRSKISPKAAQEIVDNYERTTNLLKNAEKKVEDDSFNQWQIDLKKRTDNEINIIRKELVREAKAVNGDTNLLAKLRQRISVIDSEKSTRNTNSYSYAEDYKVAKADWEQKKKILIEIEKEKTKFTTKAYEDAKNDEDVAKKKYSSLGGDISDKKEKQPVGDYEKLIQKQKEENEREKTEATRRGIEDRRKLVEEDYKTELDIIKTARKEAEIAAEKEKKPFDGTVFDTANKLTLNRKNDKLSLFDKEDADKNKEQIDALLKEFETYQQKRERIEQEYNDKIAKLAVNPEAQVEAKRQKYKVLSELDNAAQGTTSGISKLFQDMSKKSVQEMAKIANYGKDLLSFLEEDNAYTTLTDGTKKFKSDNPFGFTEAQYKTLKESPKDMEALVDQVEDLDVATQKTKSGFDKMLEGIEKVFNAGNDTKKLDEGLEQISGALQSVTVLGDLAIESLNNIAELSGNSLFSDIAEGLGTVLDVANKTMEGAKAGAQLGGAAGAIVGAGLGLLSSITGIFAEAKRRRAEAAKERADFQFEELLGEFDITQQYRERYEWAKKIGESELKHIKRKGEELTKQNKDNTADQKRLMALLQGEQYVSGIKWQKGNIFKKGKNVEEKQSLSGMDYNQIEALSAQGKLTEQAEQYFQALKRAKDEGADIAQMMLEEAERLRELTTGSSYESVVSGAMEILKRGTKSAAQTFDDIMKGAVESALNLLTDEKLRAWYEGFSKAGEDGYTADEKQYWKTEYERQLKQLEEDRKNLEDITGVKVGEGAKQQSATSKGFETMSQETASKLDGSFLSLRITAIDIRNQGLDKIKILSKMDVNLGQVLTVSNETKSFVEEIKNIQRDSFYELQGINKNTKSTTTILTAMASDIKIMKEKL